MSRFRAAGVCLEHDTNDAGDNTDENDDSQQIQLVLREQRQSRGTRRRARGRSRSERLRQDNIAICDRRYHRAGFAANTSVFFQSQNLIPFLTARENVLIALQIRDTTGASAVRVAQDLLDYLGVGDRQHLLPEQLSGGEQQRVAIARALANAPEVILADEPTAALDTDRGRSVMALFRQVARDKSSAVICVTHDERMIEGFDHVYRVRDGLVSNDGTHDSGVDATTA